MKSYHIASVILVNELKLLPMVRLTLITVPYTYHSCGYLCTMHNRVEK